MAGTLSSTLAIFRVPKQIQWFSGSGLEALSPCFATVFFCKWPKSSLGDLAEARVGEGGGAVLGRHLEARLVQHRGHDCRLLLGLVAGPATPGDEGLLGPRRAA